MTVGSRLAAAVLRLPPATASASVERDLAATMPDGATLLADRWFPTPPQDEAPTVLVRTPYGRRQLSMLGRLFAERGYQTVIQSCRGTFGSGGEWEPMRNERADGHATLEWIGAQTWFDGRLLTWGGSYLGLTQWAVAEAPRFVKAMALQITASNFRDAIVFPGGSFALETALTWLYQLHHQELGLRAVLRSQLRADRAVRAAAGVLPLGRCDEAMVGETVPFYQDWLAHSTAGDPWWDPVDFGRAFECVPPASLLGGWYDPFLPAQVADYEALRRAGRRARLTIGPWTHVSPGAFAETVRDGLDWFNERLHARTERSPVRLYVMGTKRWEEFSQWPPAGDEQTWYLGPWSTLAPELAATGGTDRFHYDPDDPTPAVGGPALNFRAAGRKDQRRRERRQDVLTYTSPVMTSDLTVIGPVTASLSLRSSREHADVFVRLCDVDSKGRSTNVSDGIVRLTPGSATRDGDGTFAVDIPMWPTANTFRAGHRIRLQVSGGAHPLFARNTGTDEPMATAADVRSTDHELLHEGSCVRLHVVALLA